MPGPVVIRFGAVGDMIMVTPLMRVLAERHGKPCAVLGTGGWLPVLLQGLPFVGEVRQVRSLRWPPWWFSTEKRAATAWLRDRGFAPVYLLQTDPFTESMVSRAHLDQVVRNDQLAQDDTEHTCRRHLRLAQARQAASGCELAVAASELTEVDAWLARQGLHGPAPILIQPGNRKTRRLRVSRSDHKIWPDERWIACIRGLADREPQRPLLIIGSAKEHLLTERLATACGLAQVHSVAHDLPLRRLLALLARAYALVSVDTGPAHAAAAVGCPVLAIFGRTDPRRTGPHSLGSRVVAVRPPQARDLPDTMIWPTGLALSDIDVASVLAAWDAAWTTPQPAPSLAKAEGDTPFQVRN